MQHDLLRSLNSLAKIRDYKCEPIAGTEMLHTAAVNLQVHPYPRVRVDNTTQQLVFTYIYICILESGSTTQHTVGAHLQLHPYPKVRVENTRKQLVFVILTSVS